MADGTIEVKAEKVAKPGIKTTEFWTTLAANALAIGVMTGYINPGQAEVIESSVPLVAGGAISLLSTVSYIFSRGKAKS